MVHSPSMPARILLGNRLSSAATPSSSWSVESESEPAAALTGSRKALNLCSLECSLRQSSPCEISVCCSQAGLLEPQWAGMKRMRAWQPAVCNDGVGLVQATVPHVRSGPCLVHTQLGNRAVARHYVCNCSPTWAGSYSRHPAASAGRSQWGSWQPWHSFQVSWRSCGLTRQRTTLRRTWQQVASRRICIAWHRYCLEQSVTGLPPAGYKLHHAVPG